MPSTRAIPVYMIAAVDLLQSALRVVTIHLRLRMKATRLDISLSHHIQNLKKSLFVILGYGAQ